MENKEQKIKMLATAIGNEQKRMDDIIKSIHKTEAEIQKHNIESARTHAELYEKYMNLCNALGSAKEYIKRCKNEYDALNQSEDNIVTKMDADKVNSADFKECDTSKGIWG